MQMSSDVTEPIWIPKAEKGRARGKPWRRNLLLQEPMYRWIIVYACYLKAPPLRPLRRGLELAVRCCGVRHNISELLSVRCLLSVDLASLCFLRTQIILS